MKYLKNSLIITFIILVVIFFVHPRKIYTEPKISGKVVDQEGKPLRGVKIYRISEYNSAIKNTTDNETDFTITGCTRTDENGCFVISEMSKLKWFHNPLDLPVLYCGVKVKAIRNGYEVYESKKDEFITYENSNIGCKGLAYETLIIMKK